MIFLDIFFVLLFLVVLGCIGMLIRDQMVYEYRTNLITKISNARQADIDAGRNYRWRYEIFDGVEYSKMVKHFWRRLDSFYPDKSFIDPEATNDLRADSGTN